MSQKSFRALGVSADVAQALAARDINMPFPIQELVIPAALTGADVLAKAPTGSGKTFAFGLPIVERADASAPTPTALVLVPTRELASQVAEELYFVAKPKRLRVAAAYGGASIASQSKRLRGAHIVVATPGRLQDLVERRLVKLDSCPDAHPRRGRPHARHGLQASGREDRPSPARRAADDALLGDARR